MITPYFPPTYFTPAYFPPGSATEAVTPGPAGSSGFFCTSYFGSSYFSPSYFAGSRATLGVIRATYRDSDAFAAVVTALTKTGEFAEVSFLFGTLGAAPLASDRMPIAVISPIRWQEDQSDQGYLIRQVSSRITLAARDTSDISAYHHIDILSDLVQASIDGSDLGGCLPALTTCRDGQPDLGSAFPEYRLNLDLDFSYLKPRPTGI